jgi:chitinase
MVHVTLVVAASLLAQNGGAEGSGAAGEATGPAIIAYVFPQEQVIDPSEIDAERLTHINYAFANIQGGQVVSGFSKDDENFRVLAALRKKHPHLKILVSVGGWSWSGAFSDAALTPASRKRFVASAVAFVGHYDLDGFDVDWEYPGLPGNGNTHRAEDKANFTSLMAELRTALEALGAPRGRHYALTFAAGASSEFLANTEMDKVQASVDFVNLMTYDFREAEGDPVSGHHANLYPNPADPKQVSADQAARDFLAAGVPARKLVLGVPFYGRAWGDVQGDGSGLYQPGKPVGVQLDTKYASLTTLVNRDGYLRVWDSTAQAPYLWNPQKRIFISYDDPESLRAKCAYIRERGLGGVMFWEYYADRSGALLRTLFDELQGKAAGK